MGLRMTTTLILEPALVLIVVDDIGVAAADGTRQHNPKTK